MKLKARGQLKDSSSPGTPAGDVALSFVSPEGIEMHVHNNFEQDGQNVFEIASLNIPNFGHGVFYCTIRKAAPLDVPTEPNCK